MILKNQNIKSQKTQERIDKKAKRATKVTFKPKHRQVKGINDAITNKMQSNLLNEILYNREMNPIMVSRDVATDIEEVDRIQFLEFHKPSIGAGTYNITVEQNTSGAGNERFKKKQQFRIDAPRYSLPQEEIYTTYPPHNASGQYVDTLPHIAFNRTTIPWERDYFKAESGAVKEGKSWKYSWLALLLFSEEEAPKLVKRRAKDLGLPTDTKTEAKTPFNCIKVSPALLAKIQADDGDAPYLSHVKIFKPNEDSDEDEVAQGMIMCNRFPILGTTNVVHLVALENDPAKHKNYLVSLHNWSFYCEAGITGFEDTLKKVSVGGYQLTLPKGQTNDYLNRGYVPMPHHLRRGEKVLSWYHGPLVPYFKQLAAKNPAVVNHADDLLQLDSASQMLDISYSSAWQLGRMLTLQEKNIAIDIYMWKRQSERMQKNELLENLKHITISDTDEEKKIGNVPDSIYSWIDDFFECKNIPYNYLVPHPELLPEESLRFFRVDMNWLQQCISGILSIGTEILPPDERVTPKDNDDINTNYPFHYTGFLLRSKVVKDYPDLLIAGYHTKAEGDATIDEAEFGMPISLRRKLGEDVLLIVFQGEKGQRVRTVDVFIKPVGLHFGVSSDDVNNDGKPEFWKQPREYDLKDLAQHGTKDENKKARNITKFVNEHNCLNVDKFAKEFFKVEKDAASFAFQMLEGTPKVRFFDEG